MTHSLNMDHIKSLTIEQRLELIDEIWETISDEGDTGLSVEIKRELDRRLIEDDANPESGSMWADVQERLRSR